MLLGAVRYAGNVLEGNIDNIDETGLFAVVTTGGNVQGSLVSFRIANNLKYQLYFDDKTGTNQRCVKERRYYYSAWTPWQRIDNYGTTSLDGLASALGVNTEYTGLPGQKAYKLFTADTVWVRHLAFIVCAFDTSVGILLLSATNIGSTYLNKCICLGGPLSDSLKIYQDADDYYVFNSSVAATNYKILMVREDKSGIVTFDVTGKTEITQQ